MPYTPAKPPLTGETLDSLSARLRDAGAMHCAAPARPWALTPALPRPALPSPTRALQHHDGRRRVSATEKMIARLVVRCRKVAPAFTIPAALALAARF